MERWIPTVRSGHSIQAGASVAGHPETAPRPGSGSRRNGFSSPVARGSFLPFRMPGPGAARRDGFRRMPDRRVRRALPGEKWKSPWRDCADGTGAQLSRFVLPEPRSRLSACAAGRCPEPLRGAICRRGMSAIAALLAETGNWAVRFAAGARPGSRLDGGFRKRGCIARRFWPGSDRSRRETGSGSSIPVLTRTDRGRHDRQQKHVREAPFVLIAISAQRQGGWGGTGAGLAEGRPPGRKVWIAMPVAAGGGASGIRESLRDVAGCGPVVAIWLREPRRGARRHRCVFLRAGSAPSETARPRVLRQPAGTGRCFAERSSTRVAFSDWHSERPQAVGFARVGSALIFCRTMSGLGMAGVICPMMPVRILLSAATSGSPHFLRNLGDPDQRRITVLVLSIR